MVCFRLYCTLLFSIILCAVNMSGHYTDYGMEPMADRLLTDGGISCRPTMKKEISPNFCGSQGTCYDSTAMVVS